MEKKNYDYNEWLSTHTKSKTMMEKLERSLIPYDLFAAIDMKNDKEEHTGEVTIDDNTYRYHIKYDYRCIGHDVYDALLEPTDIRNKWHNMLMGYNRFKLVMDHQSIKTIYSDHEDYFQRIIEMFENDDWGALYQNRCSYVNNLLARYILLRLLYNEHLEWHFDRIERVVADPPFYGKHMAEQKKKLKGKKNKASKARKKLDTQGLP